ncbi:hypothetical protein CR513_54014, partial [Mucuna pruriens]
MNRAKEPIGPNIVGTHKNYGHTTEACKTLRDRIGELMTDEQGHLEKKIETSRWRDETTLRRDGALNLG